MVFQYLSGTLCFNLWDLVARVVTPGLCVSHPVPHPVGECLNGGVVRSDKGVDVYQIRLVVISPNRRSYTWESTDAIPST